MTAMKKGLLVAVIQVLLVTSLGLKLLVDRATRPRVWVQSVSYDPNLPIRGRYVALRARLQTDVAPPSDKNYWYATTQVRLEVRDGKLFGVQDPAGSVTMSWVKNRNGQWEAMTSEPSLFFIPDTAIDPSFRKSGEQLWFEATIPKKGQPRPIRLAVSRPDGTFTPLETR